MYKQTQFFRLVLSIVLSILLLCGCSVSYQKPTDSSNTTANSTTAAKSQNSTTNAEATTVALPSDPQADITSAVQEILKDEEFSSMTLDDLTATQDSDEDKLYSVTLAITWNAEMDAPIAQSLAQKRSNAISVAVASRLPYVSHLTISYTMPYLDDAKASVSFKKNGSSLIQAGSQFDEHFTE